MLDTCRIHPSAVVEHGASIGAGVRIGPFCHIGPEAIIGDEVELRSHVVVTGATDIGARTLVFPHATLGSEPQNNKHTGGRTTLTIGSGCVFRESVTAHAGSDTSRGATTIGDNCMFLAGSHIAHDCEVGNNVTIANCSALGGHCEIGDNVIIGGMSGLHQFVRIGHNAFVGGATALRGDLIPYGMAVGADPGGNLRGLNVVGLKRSGVQHKDLKILRKAYNLLFNDSRSLVENAGLVREEFADSRYAIDLADFITERASRHFCVPPRERMRRNHPDDKR